MSDKDRRRRDEEREKRARDRQARDEEDERRAETERRGEELQEGWRRRHPREGHDGPERGRP